MRFGCLCGIRLLKAFRLLLVLLLLVLLLLVLLLLVLMLVFCCNFYAE